MHHSARHRVSQHDRTMRDLARFDQGERAPQSIKALRKLTEERLEYQLQYANSILSLDKVKALIFETDVQEFRTYLAAMITALNPDRAIDEKALSHRLNLLSHKPKIDTEVDGTILQLIQDAWNYLPHRFLDGRCPAEAMAASDGMP